MLTTCKECGLPVSDKAVSCPHCGYPMVPNTAKTKYKRAHKRLPNGFGQITELKNRNLRKPYRAMVTVGKNINGRPICKILKPTGYFATYNEAYAALMEYAKNPYDLDKAMTMSELFDEWFPKYKLTLKSSSSERTITSAWSHCTQVYSMPVTEIRARHIKGCMDQAPSANTKSRIKSVFNLLLDYAVEYELVDRNYARSFNIDSTVKENINSSKIDHKSFTEVELELLWHHTDNRYVRMILIQCYMGWRPQELGLLRLENINLDTWFIIGGMKTDAGTDRPVPVHPGIRPLVREFYDEAVGLGSSYLLNCTDSKNINLSYDKYQKRFYKVMAELSIEDHRPHDGRKTFVTMAKNKGVDEYAIKYMVGHSISDLTESTYTDRNLDWLMEEICKI